MQQITPIGDKILVQPLEDESKTISGIMIPESAKEKPQRGIIIALGSGENDAGEKVKFQVKVGDKVYFKKWGGNDIKIEGKEHLIVKQEDILAIIE